MWSDFSLRTRLCVLLSSLFLVALIGGVFLLRVFAHQQIVDENEPAARSVGSIAVALNSALKASDNPAETLEAFAGALATATPGAIRFRRVDEAHSVVVPVTSRVPKWFLFALNVPDLSQKTPIYLSGMHLGDLVYDPDMSAEIFEKWVGFLAIFTAATGLALVAAVLTFFTVGAALRPLQDLGDGLDRVRNGNFTQPIVCTGPPEVRQSCASVNALGDTLSELNRENRALMRKMIYLQDEERRDISRELHDELGPLLFAIRANVTAMVELDANAPVQGEAHERVLESVARLQLTNRRILDRLRPLYIEELGLELSVQKLLREVNAQAPNMKTSVEIDAEIIKSDSVITQTVYRILQEGITNVLKHAQATKMILRAVSSPTGVTIEISDNGVGPMQDQIFGRGLTGIRERSRALNGKFDLLRNDGWTMIRCVIPIGS